MRTMTWSPRPLSPRAWRSSVRRLRGSVLLTGFLHRSGGQPRYDADARRILESSSRAWRSPSPDRNRGSLGFVFSTKVEVSPRCPFATRTPTYFLHGRGGQPMRSRASQLGVVSTEVEVFPGSPRRLALPASCLHVGGGLPLHAIVRQAMAAFSPRKWRSAVRGRHILAATTALSTGVEVYPPTPPGSSMRKSRLHEGGGLPVPPERFEDLLEAVSTNVEVFPQRRFHDGSNVGRLHERGGQPANQELSLTSIQSSPRAWRSAGRPSSLSQAGHVVSTRVEVFLGQATCKAITHIHSPRGWRSSLLDNLELLLASFFTGVEVFRRKLWAMSFNGHLHEGGGLPPR